MAAAVADFTPGCARRGQDQEGRRASELELELRADGRRARRLWPRDGARGRRSSASPPSTARTRSSSRAGKLAAKGLDAVVVNDISRGDIGFDVDANEVTMLRRRRRRAAHVAWRSRRAEQGRGRGGDPRRRRRAHCAGAKLGPMESVYDLYTRGCELLDHGDHQAAIVPAQQSPRPRAGQGLDPRGARAGAVPRAALRRRRRRVRGGRRAHAHERLRAVLPRPRDAAARPPPRGLSAARAGVLAAARARGLPALPGPRPARRRSGPEPARWVDGPMLCSMDSFRAGAQASGAVPRVGARPLFLRKESVR